jgi:RHS repeat-associated protein
MKIVNATGTLIEEHSYDAWGNHRKPTDWTLVDFASTLGISRGFTGHEMLPLFQLINMNGRMYDPVIGRVLSPDNFVANALNSQAYNRYSYCLNNPLKFIDPTGEKWKWWRWMSLCVGLSDPATAAATMSIAGSVIAGTAGVVAGVSFGTAGANTVFSYFTGLCDDNATFANRLGNYWKIAAGQFATDKDLTFEQRIWQFMSRHTIEQPFTTMGFAAQNTINAYSFYSKDEVKVGYFHGATVVQTDLMNGVGGFTLGSSITISTNSGALDYDNNALVHEYGHYLQIRHYGALPMLSMSASSLLSAMLSDKHSNDPSWHDWNWTEQDAVARSLAYFGDKMTDAQKDRFLNTYSNGFRAYYDGRFLRSYLFPASWEYLLYDYWFRN